MKPFCVAKGLKTLCLLLISTAFCAQLALADEAKSFEITPFSVRAGYLGLNAEHVKGDATLGGMPLPGSYLSMMDEDHQAAFISWNFAGDFSLETVVANPIGLEVKAGGGLFGEEFKAATIDTVPVLLMGRYTAPLDWWGIKPFASAGAAYIVFWNKETTSEFDALAASLGATGGNISVDNQLRPALSLGVDYDFHERWFANFTWLYIEGEDSITVSFTEGVSLVSEVSYEVQFTAFTLGYRF